MRNSVQIKYFWKLDLNKIIFENKTKLIKIIINKKQKYTLNNGAYSILIIFAFITLEIFENKLIYPASLWIRNKDSYQLLFSEFT